LPGSTTKREIKKRIYPNTLPMFPYLLLPPNLNSHPSSPSTL
jgi:hypothetical protein